MSVAWALGATFIVGVFILIGYFIVMTTKNNHRVMNFSISMAFGVMTSLVLLELLPESFEHLSDGQNEIITICYLLLLSPISNIILSVLLSRSRKLPPAVGAYLLKRGRNKRNRYNPRLGVFQKAG